MKRWLRLALALQVTFFAVWGYQLLTSFDGAPEIILETVPVDPRDYLHGHYVALNYAHNNRSHLATLPGCSALQIRDYYPDKDFYLRFEKREQSAYAVAVECSLEKIAATDARLWVIAHSNWRGVQIGIERYYLAETSPQRNAKSGEVVARVAINKHRQARILELQTVPAKNR